MSFDIKYGKGKGKGKESAFVRKCYSRKVIHHRIMLISKKHSAAPKTMR